MLHVSRSQRMHTIARYNLTLWVDHTIIVRVHFPSPHFSSNVTVFVNFFLAVSRTSSCAFPVYIAQIPDIKMCRIAIWRIDIVVFKRIAVEPCDKIHITAFANAGTMHSTAHSFGFLACSLALWLICFYLYRSFIRLHSYSLCFRRYSFRFFAVPSARYVFGLRTLSLCVLSKCLCTCCMLPLCVHASCIPLASSIPCFVLASSVFFVGLLLLQL